MAPKSSRLIDGFIKAPESAAIGTGFRGVRLSATRQDLESVIGSAHALESGDGKVSFSWVFQTIVDGELKVVTVYDWKEASPVGRRIVDWHVGGNSTLAAYRLARVVKSALGDDCEVLEPHEFSRLVPKES